MLSKAKRAAAKPKAAAPMAMAATPKAKQSKADKTLLELESESKVPCISPAKEEDHTCYRDFVFGCTTPTYINTMFEVVVQSFHCFAVSPQIYIENVLVVW